MELLACTTISNEAGLLLLAIMGALGLVGLGLTFLFVRLLIGIGNLIEGRRG